MRVFVLERCELWSGARSPHRALARGFSLTYTAFGQHRGRHRRASARQRAHSAQPKHDVYAARHQPMPARAKVFVGGADISQ